MNPATALAAVLADELIRCGLRDVVLAPGSRSAPLAMEFHRRAQAGDLRLSVRIDERSAAFCALGLAKASRPAGGRRLHLGHRGRALPRGRHRGGRVRQSRWSC